MFSLIIPMYNEENILPATLQTLHTYMQANFDDYEILFSDDGSTDRTAELAERFANADTRIRLLRNPQNMGVARTRNRGFDMANGDWAALLDSDDVWHSDKLEKQLAAAERSGTIKSDILRPSASIMEYEQ